MVYDAVELINHLKENLEYYHRAIWWSMDRDRLFMLMDGFFVPGLDPPTSVSSIVDKNPVGIAGNSLIFRISSGCYIPTTLGDKLLDTPESLTTWYRSRGSVSAPMHISLPTDGLYAQTIMDECVALEEHFGNTDWALQDADPELGAVDQNLLGSRKSDVGKDLAPTKMPDTLINLQNALPAPAPQGLSDIISAVQNGNAFRDMAGLAGTQGLTSEGLKTAAALATNFGNQAAALKLAELANKQQAVSDIDKKLAAFDKAKQRGLASDDEIAQHTNDALASMNGGNPTIAANTEQTTPKETKEAIKVIEDQVKKKNISKEEGKSRISEQVKSMKGSKHHDYVVRSMDISLQGKSGLDLLGAWNWSLTTSKSVEDPVFHRVDVAVASDPFRKRYPNGKISFTWREERDSMRDRYTFNLEGKLWGDDPSKEQSLDKGMAINRAIPIRFPKGWDTATVSLQAETKTVSLEVKAGLNLEAAFKSATGFALEWLYSIATLKLEGSKEISLEAALEVDGKANFTVEYYTRGFNVVSIEYD